ncbi:PaaI family thioesterase [Lawsonibacter celer]|uniref:PaaI family thioesterase n=1 Tax=Lawsonibacter celer TaxID=2986526 RepID=UPI001648AA3D|nr:PaaI family thioesterase [Lawsonibacter celer]
MDPESIPQEVLFEKLLRHSLKDGYAGHNDIRVTALREGFAQGELLASDQALNPLKMVHGGALTGLADTIAGFAVCTLGVQSVTNDCLMTFLRPARPGRLVCTAQVRKAGKKVCIVHATVCDEAGTELAIGTFNFSIIGELKFRHP